MPRFRVIAAHGVVIFSLTVGLLRAGRSSVLAGTPAARASAVISINGNFDRLTAAGNPVGWSGSALGTSSALAGVTLVPRARLRHNAMLLHAPTGAAVAVLNQTRTRPVLKGVVSFWYQAIASTVGGRNLAFYVIPFTARGREGGATRTEWLVPSGQVGDGRWHHARFRYDYVHDLAVRAIMLCPRVNETGFSGAGNWMISGVRLRPLPYSTKPQFKLLAFGGSAAPLVRGQPFDISLAVINTGRTAARNIHASLRLGAGLRETALLAAPARLASGAAATFRWRCQPVRSAGTVGALVRLKCANGAPVSVRWASVILPPVGQWAGQPGTIAVGQGKLRLVFPALGRPGHRRYEACAIQRRLKSVWLTVAVLPRLAQVIAQRGVGMKFPLARVSRRRPASIQFVYRARAWKATVTMGVGPGGHRIQVAARLRARHDLKLLAFRCPDLRVGDGTFGGAKYDAIFPGLEYLNAQEHSSSTEFVWPPGSQRWTPNPLRMTMPMMALADGGVVVTLTWNACARWGGAEQGYAAQFACPNRLVGQNDTRLALLVPTVPRWVPENGMQAEKPYRLAKGRALALAATIVVQRGKSALDGLKTVEETWGRRWPIAPAPRTMRQEIALCARTFLHVLWVSPAKGWHPTLYGWAPTPDPAIAMQMLKMARYIRPPRLAADLRGKALAVMALHPAASDIDLALWNGGVRRALRSARGAALTAMRSQRADGTWGFAPDTAKRKTLGRTGATNVGICATHLLPIASYVLVTRAPRAVRALLKGLAAMRRFQIPAGAQVWECPLDEPDILAAAQAIRVELAGYLVTGRRRYLRRAVHWAWTGVPFVYQWRPPDRPIMLGATTPVFGSSFFGWSWMGRPVQWNGLAYANSLLKLAPYDRSLDWRRLAASITHCGIQEQSLQVANLGCYPDSYHLLSNGPFPPWLNPSVILTNLWELKQGPCAYPTSLVWAHGAVRWMVTSGAPCSGRAARGVLHLRITPRRGLVSRLIISAPGRPSRVLLDGAALPVSTGSGGAGGAWHWDAVDGVAIITLDQGKPLSLLIQR